MIRLPCLVRPLSFVASLKAELAAVGALALMALIPIMHVRG